jgi:hypothetical protein
MAVKLDSSLLYSCSNCHRIIHACPTFIIFIMVILHYLPLLKKVNCSARCAIWVLSGELFASCLHLRLLLQTHSTPDLSRRHHLHPFSLKLKCGWEDIWRKVVYFNKLNNVSSNVFQNMSSGLADNTAKNLKNFKKCPRSVVAVHCESGF